MRDKEVVIGLSVMLFGFSAGFAVNALGNDAQQADLTRVDLIDSAADRQKVQEFCSSMNYENGYQNAGPGAGRLEIYCYNQNENKKHFDTFKIEKFGRWVAN